ncbi:hypothetical protein PGTUg99_037019 [Puccinia graminis f. sp. tritici]|uniref:Uncharacterized protein n=1 Tax=Puccinia graminis f. sp. tritici TaxID=56615 RepID=A0A5B0QVK5_PUCGR|nr:hypothetical protein PGTUg99_037019 [Puccinia graminis f. sp. tritici]
MKIPELNDRFNLNAFDPIVKLTTGVEESVKKSKQASSDRTELAEEEESINSWLTRPTITKRLSLRPLHRAHGPSLAGPECNRPTVLVHTAERPSIRVASPPYLNLSIALIVIVLSTVLVVCTSSSLGRPDRNWGAFLDYTLQPKGSQFDPVASPPHITPNRVIRSLRPLRCADG